MSERAAQVRRCVPAAYWGAAEPHYSAELGPLLGKSLEEENKAETVIGLMGPLQSGFLGKLTHDVRP